VGRKPSKPLSQRKPAGFLRRQQGRRWSSTRDPSFLNKREQGWSWGAGVARAVASQDAEIQLNARAQALTSLSEFNVDDESDKVCR
jgi:hypothetical protein